MKRVEFPLTNSGFNPPGSGLAPCQPSPFRVRPLMLIIFFGFTLMSASAITAPGNPYGAIVGRNVFGLKPPTVVTTVVEEPKVPAPKIRLQGLTTILGKRQVLFKAMLPAKPGEPAKEQASVLSEGQREGEIEVLAIDEVAGTVKFNNYGYVMTLNMKDDAEKAGSGGAPAPGVPQPGVIPPPLMPGLPMPTPISNPSPGVQMPPNIPTRSLRTSPTTPNTGAGVTGGISGVPATAQSSTPTPAPPALSRDEQEVLIEVRRQYYKDQGDARSKVLPPTSMTPPKEPTPPTQP